MNDTRDVAAWMQGVRTRVDAKLEQYLEAKLVEGRATSPDSIELVEGIRDLTLRGGKRLRPIVVDAAYRCVASDPDDDATTCVGAALELLQSYLLIHDDWMDQDDERRGGPAVHAQYRAAHETHLANALAILAGDLASAYAWELLFEAPYPAATQRAAYDRFVVIQKEVFFGQHLDLTANADVSRMHDLKTGSYTVRGPLLLGALLGGANQAQLDAMLAYGDPLGEAFQLADDLIGTFGDQDETGKPGNDLRNRKRTCLVSETEQMVPEAERGALTDLFASESPTEAQVAAAAKLIVDCGARTKVETRLEKLLGDAHQALDNSPFDGPGVDVLRYVAERLAIRRV